jgi:hypothetical protein
VIRDRHDIEHEIKTGNVIAGDPARVIEIIHGWREALGLTTISGTIFFGGLPQELALRNIRTFAEKVMPEFRTGSERRETAGSSPTAVGEAR